MRVPGRALLRASQRTKGVGSMRGHVRRVATLGVLLGMATLLTLLTASSAGAASADRTAASGSISPIVECSVKRHGGNHSVFGYRNTGPARRVLVGTDNQFTPGSPDRGQPTTFESGTHINVFSVTESASLTWTLEGQRVSAPGVLCATDPASSNLASWGPVGALVIVTALLGSLLYWRNRRLRVRAR